MFFTPCIYCTTSKTDITLPKQPKITPPAPGPGRPPEVTKRQQNEEEDDSDDTEETPLVLVSIPAFH